MLAGPRVPEKSPTRASFKGDEIINTLIHLTDQSQNTHFQDKYFSGIDLDLSKSFFIFSYNDENKIKNLEKSNKLLSDSKALYKDIVKEMKKENKESNSFISSIIRNYIKN